MNKFLNRLERKYGRYALRNLPMVIIACYAAGFVITMMAPNLINYLTLNPDKILDGQIWRVLTWVLIPPFAFDFFAIIAFIFYYSIALSLERVWGTFRFNLYILSGILFTVIGSFLLFPIASILDTDLYVRALGIREVYYAAVSLNTTTIYLNASIFLAYAVLFANHQILLMFIIPIKVKYLGILEAAIYGYYLIHPSFSFEMKYQILVSLFNFLLFFFVTRNYQRIAPGEVKRRRQFRQAVKEGNRGVVTSLKGKTVVTRHKCAICQRTELDDPNLEFRFCSKCDGNYEYCSDHLFTHEHVKKI